MTSDRVLFFIYRMLVAPLAVLLLPIAALFNKKIAAGLRLRRQRRSSPDWPNAPIWIHAASGEFEYAKAVIRELKTRLPSVPILVTYFSPTYARGAENFPGVDLALPLPLDLPGPCISFLKRHKPRLLLLARTDFWPEMLYQTRRLGIPIWLFSYTQKNPNRLSLFGKRITAWRLRMIDRIFCVSPEDVGNAIFLGLQPARFEPLGDTRYDQVFHRLKNAKELPMQNTSHRPCLVAGSTWPEDEAVLIPALSPALSENRLRLVLVPHETDAAHIESVKRLLQKYALDFQLFSSRAPWGEAQVLVVDEVGWLAELYLWADLAFVGGSFRKSVHSVMEALGAGAITLVGPHHANNREAVEFQSVNPGASAAVVVTTNSEALRNAVEKILGQDLEQTKQALRKAFSARLGASSKLTARIGAEVIRS